MYEKMWGGCAHSGYSAIRKSEIAVYDISVVHESVILNEISQKDKNKVMDTGNRSLVTREEGLWDLGERGKGWSILW